MIVILTYGALLLGAFLIANSEASKATKAQETASVALKHAEALDAKILELKAELAKYDDSLASLISSIITSDSKALGRSEDLAKKIEWLEMKFSSIQRPQSPPKVLLTQDKPIQVTVITRQGPPAQLKKKAQATNQPESSDQNAALTESIKKKLVEFN